VLQRFVNNNPGKVNQNNQIPCAIITKTDRKSTTLNYEQADIYSTRLGQSERLLESVSGVSLDEELLDLTRFEKQFAANGKVIQTVNELMDSVLDLVR
jgi:flagellar hook-associated protein FlgK